MSIDEDITNLWDGIKTDKCISFDLDLTLVNTFTDIESIGKLNVFNGKNRALRQRIYTLDLHDVVNDPGEGVYSRMWGAYRPGWQKFYLFCQRYFKSIIVWSAGQPKYVDAVVDILFTDPNFQPIVIYNWTHCKRVGDYTIHKPLKMLYEDPRTADIVSPEKIFALDDREDTFSLNKGNGILIPAYEIKPRESHIMKDDTRLTELEKWFSQEKVANCKDVRLLDKTTIFSSKTPVSPTKKRK
jgi:hypothetical protein